MANKIIQHQDIDGLCEMLLNDDGKLNVVDAKEYEQFTQDQISYFCVQKGFYCLPTTELIKFLSVKIGDRKAIEIGAGNGSVGRALNIKMTDNYQQNMLRYKTMYERMQQTTVPYGDDVLQMDAKRAIEYHKPDVVLACWVTHKYNPLHHYKGGNEIGVDEEHLLANIKEYIFVGNATVHAEKPILKRQHDTLITNWLVSRAFEPEFNVIKIWKGDK